MYANIVSIHYKSANDAEEALKKMESHILPEVRKVPGFRTFHLVRTSETTTLHIGVFDSPENAEKGRKDVYPVLRDMVMPHAEGSPNVQHGHVRITA